MDIISEETKAKALGSIYSTLTNAALEAVKNWMEGADKKRSDLLLLGWMRSQRRLETQVIKELSHRPVCSQLVNEIEKTAFEENADFVVHVSFGRAHHPELGIDLKGVYSIVIQSPIETCFRAYRFDGEMFSLAMKPFTKKELVFNPWGGRGIPNISRQTVTPERLQKLRGFLDDCYSKIRKMIVTSTEQALRNGVEIETVFILGKVVGKGRLILSPLPDDPAIEGSITLRAVEHVARKSMSDFVISVTLGGVYHSNSNEEKGKILAVVIQSPVANKSFVYHIEGERLIPMDEKDAPSIPVLFDVWGNLTPKAPSDPDVQTMQ